MTEDDRQFLFMVSYFAVYHQDPERYVGYDDLRLHRLAPDLWTAWHTVRGANKAMRIFAQQVLEETGDKS